MKLICLTDRTVIEEYTMGYRGGTAPGAIVLRDLGAERRAARYVVHFRNDQDSIRCGHPVYYYGDYCSTLDDARIAYRQKIDKYDRYGDLRRLRQHQEIATEGVQALALFALAA